MLANGWLVEVLRGVREVDPPDWAVGAGVIRNLVWDHLHGFEEPSPLKDLDVAFFDPTDLSRERDAELEAELARRLPGVPWDVTNQAGVHLWYEQRFGHPIEPIRSIEDGVARWPETATAVAIRLLPDGGLHVIAPCGLDDLFGLVLRRNPRQVSRELFRQRLATKGIQRTWPRVRIVDEP